MLPTHKLQGLVDPPYPDSPGEFGPVETTTGNQMRLTAIYVLEKRRDVLESRAKLQRLTEVEYHELRGNLRTIDTLKGMAPIAGLVPPRASALV